MEANRFATMLHRRTNRITVVLVYAVLEWFLILLLFLSSIFSHLIIKFAKYFGLQPPCLWCTRIDHIFNSSNGNKDLHRDLLCETHAKQVSGFGFCSIHNKLSESQTMCNDCLLSMPEFACFSGIKDYGNDEIDGELQTPNCSCCGISLLRRKTSSLVDLLYTHVSKEGDHGFGYLEKGDSDEKMGSYLKVEECVHVLDESSSNQHLEYFVDHTVHNLVPVELVKDEEILKIECDDKAENQECRSDSDSEMEKREALADDNGGFIDVGVDKEPKDSDFEALSDDNERFIDLGMDKEPQDEVLEALANDNDRFIDLGVDKEPEDSDFEALSDDNGRFIDLCVDKEPKDEVLEALANDNDRFIDLGVSDEPKDAIVEALADDNGRFNDLNVDNELKDAVSGSIVVVEDQNSLVYQADDILVNPLSHCPSVDASETKLLDSHTDDEEAAQVHNESEAVVSIGTEIPELDMNDELQLQESENFKERVVDLQPLSLNHSASFNLETQENEEDKVPDTPASMDSFIQLHKKVFSLEKRNSWAEESFDGSITSELEIGDGVVTNESLKSALKAERKALKILYTEFVEERSASAVAASQTMAMINRLQEEKAAMQMEALQYQRMMEEQSEYDQDALQLMNELMVKKENEKRELAKELEECRRKLFDYESKEKAKVLRSSEDKNSRNGFSSASSINADDLEVGTQELGEEATSPYPAIKRKEPLFDFENERQSILEQLSVLEEKLFSVNDAKHQHSVQTADAHLITSGDDCGVHVNGSLNDTAESKHRKRIRSSDHKGKSLLPLFNAISNDQMVQPNGVCNSTEHDYEDEMCHLYERLETLEADKEFLKQCISSLKQGDKELVHEILHSLRQLRNMELQARTRQQQDFSW